ncbi:Holliday junction resolvase RuvX [Nitratifractor salsuginis]|uniref:Putative pre-16S rRNA nuclease n=1 Tax=Nitratifractor salsuginis (strain DSM 16511 / JCM 12458 / E9I37-1) TaxID=749222 RepID=E6X0T8_NITSE|nr:Holliday junction resolvase RuvX [Nitratifractor salsuginis]ADV46870.1 Holliday junction resolvase YqgF [Nitratifractor salsuginis DSM 16511]
MIAAVDVGLKRIGVAISPDGRIVLPQRAIERRGRKQAAKELSDFLREWKVDLLVVGLPRGGSSEEEMERRIRHFVSLLELPPQMEVHYQDEAGSSEEAKERMQGAIRQKRDGRIDSLAAQIILERWLERS